MTAAASASRLIIERYHHSLPTSNEVNGAKQSPSSSFFTYLTSSTTKKKDLSLFSSFSFFLYTHLCTFSEIAQEKKRNNKNVLSQKKGNHQSDLCKLTCSTLLLHTPSKTLSIIIIQSSNAAQALSCSHDHFFHFLRYIFYYSTFFSLFYFYHTTIVFFGR